MVKIQRLISGRARVFVQPEYFSQREGKMRMSSFLAINLLPVTKHDAETTITFLESACICVTSCEFLLCRVMCFRFRTTTSNIGLKQYVLFITHECKGVKASNLQHDCIIIVCCMSMSSLIVTRPLVMEIGSR